MAVCKIFILLLYFTNIVLISNGTLYLKWPVSVSALTCCSDGRFIRRNLDQDPRLTRMAFLCVGPHDKKKHQTVATWSN